MGQNSACCNPTTQITEPQSISLPKEVFNIEPTTGIPEQFLQPNEEILQTIKKGQEYLLKHLRHDVNLTSNQLWRIEVKKSDKRQVVHCRGGTKGTTLNGKVMLYFPNKQVFKGYVQDNRPVYGIFAFRHDCFYAGEMKGFNAEGEGKFENHDSGYTYEGTWAKSLPHGKGKQVYANGDRFEGELMYGAKFGSGKYSFHNGNVYEGSFYYNQSDGKGKLTYANGNSYDGEWKLGLFNGNGVFVWVNGQSYVGEYIEGKRHGLGKYYFKNGSYYEGRWVNSLQDGEGVIRDKFDQIKGVWEQGELVN